MKSKTKRRITLATLSGFCLSALVCGAVPFAYEAITAKAEEDEGPVYAQDFESLSGTSTAAQIGTGTGWSGANLSVSVTEGLYVEIPFDGAANITMWANQTPDMASGEEYKVTTRFRPYGKFTMMELTGGDDSTSTSCIQVTPEQETITSSNVKQWQGTYNFTLVNNVTKTADGWWDVAFTLTGTGSGAEYWRFGFSGQDATTGVDLAEFKVEKGSEVLLSTADKITPSLKNTAEEPGRYAVFQAIGWDVGANAAARVAGIDGKSLKAVYTDFESNGTSSASGNVKLAKDITLENEKKYAVEYDVAPLGNIDEINFDFKQTGASNSVLNSGAIKLIHPADFNTNNTGDIFDLEGQKITYNSSRGVYHVKAEVLGKGGTLEIAAGIKATSRMGETGFYIDNVTVGESLPTPAIGVKRTTWNSSAEEDLLVYVVNFDSADSVKLGDTVFTAETDYTIANGILTIKAAALAEMEDGDHTLEITVGDRTLTATVRVIQAPMAEVYETDFETLVDLVENLETPTGNNNAFYQNSSFNPGDWDVSISTADFEDGHGRAVRFRPTKKTDCFIFQTNPASISGMEPNKWNTMSMDLKPENGATTFRIQVIAFSNVPSFWEKTTVNISINVVEGTSDINNANIGWSVVPLENGWYRVSVSFYFEEARACSVYGRFWAANEKGDFGAESSSWCVDNFMAKKEMIPSYVRGNGLYDLGADTSTYYLLDLCGEVYDIVSVKLGSKTLAEGTDYTLPQIPGAYVRLQLTDSFREQYELGFSGTIEVTTSRKNTVLSLPFSVANTKPVVPTDAIAYDIAADLTARQGVTVTADLLGYNFDYITYDGEELLGSEFNYDAAAKKIGFKQSYLKSLAVGNHEYTLFSATGSSAKFTIAVSDTRPAFGNALTYDKKTGGDLKLDLNLFDRDILSIVLNGKTLTSEQFSFADNKLTVKEAVVSEFIAGEYELTVTTIVAVTVKLTVVDVPPVISSTNVTATQDADLVLDVALSNKAIVSITVGGLPLTTEDYTCENGKLTIKGDVLKELALGEKKVVLVTEGGTAELTFTLSDVASGEQGDSGCNSSITGSLIGFTVVGALAAVALVKKKKN